MFYRVNANKTLAVPHLEGQNCNTKEINLSLAIQNKQGSLRCNY